MNHSDILFPEPPVNHSEARSNADRFNRGLIPRPHGQLNQPLETYSSSDSELCHPPDGPALDGDCGRFENIRDNEGIFRNAPIFPQRFPATGSGKSMDAFIANKFPDPGTLNTRSAAMLVGSGSHSKSMEDNPQAQDPNISQYGHPYWISQSDTESVISSLKSSNSSIAPWMKSLACNMSAAGSNLSNSGSANTSFENEGSLIDRVSVTSDKTITNGLSLSDNTCNLNFSQTHRPVDSLDYHDNNLSKTSKDSYPRSNCISANNNNWDGSVTNGHSNYPSSPTIPTSNNKWVNAYSIKRYSPSLDLNYVSSEAGSRKPINMIEETYARPSMCMASQRRVTSNRDSRRRTWSPAAFERVLKMVPNYPMRCYYSNDHLASIENENQYDEIDTLPRKSKKGLDGSPPPTLNGSTRDRHFWEVGTM